VCNVQACSKPAEYQKHHNGVKGL